MRENFWHSTFYWAARGVVWCWLRTKYRLRVSGLEHVPAQGGVIFAANHTSYLDPPALGCAINTRIVHFMARDTLLSSPIARFFFKHAQVIPLDRTRGDLAALRKAISFLKDGKAIGLFPEGTRSKDGTPQAAKGGIGFLLAKGGAPVVPMYISGTFQAFPRGSSKFLPSRITVNIGAPIPPEELLAAMADAKDYASVGSLVMQRIGALAPPPPAQETPAA